MTPVTLLAAPPNETTGCPNNAEVLNNIKKRASDAFITGEKVCCPESFFKSFRVFPGSGTA
jgi:hypothetical protein